MTSNFSNHDCLTDNEWDVDIFCHKCKKQLNSKTAEKLWNYLRVTKW